MLEVGVGSNDPQSSVPQERDPVPIVQEAGWASWSVWTGAENPRPHWDSIPGPYKPQQVAIPTMLSQPWLMVQKYT
jgi:hypothetical protein